jgi:hypothetical protein
LAKAMDLPLTRGRRITTENTDVTADTVKTKWPGTPPGHPVVNP